MRTASCAALGVGASARSLCVGMLKRGWKVSPLWLRMLAVKGVSLLWADPRNGDTAGEGPVYVCGAFRSNSGLGQSARLYVAKRRRMGEQVLPVDVTKTMLQRTDYTPVDEPLSLEQVRPMHGPGTVVIHANPPQFHLVLCRLGKEFLRNKRVVGFWSWELESIPDIWMDALRYVDALEAPSEFVQRVLRQYTTKNVSCFPHEISVPTRSKAAFAQDGIIRCLYVFDAGSSWERKNPYATLRAFQKAFAPGEAELTFKVSNVGVDNSKFEPFLEQCNMMPWVRIITDDLTPMDMEDLFVRHDIYLSLHRSEGYGLTIREAMLHGLHVVATGWSGNVEFMKGDKCHAVPFRLVPVNMACGAYKGLTARWAEADTDAAADILRDVRKNILGQNDNT